ncbi:MAG: helix-turn-helix transcriptional regulator [Deltaproteobacteria bacterium]|nr:helix-turn-helix transcriptional regulator [Deltaproteobacteria bacterium]
MMNKLPYPVLTDVLEVISAANESMDGKLVRQKALSAFFHSISAEGGILFLPDGRGQLTSIILEQLEKAYCKYYKTYYHQFDPLQLTHGLDTKGRLPYLEKVISYDSFRPTEYYNDFLKPQKIHHKLIVNLVAEKKLYGRIVLTRPRKSRRFAEKEIRTAKAISPYLAHALAHNDLRKRITLSGNILAYIEKQSTGVILLDESLRIVYKNPRAEEICGKLKGSGSAENHTDVVFSRLLKDCQEIRSNQKSWPTGGMTIPRHSVVNGPNQSRFSLVSKVLDQESDLEDSQMFMVSIEERSPANIDPQYLMDTFHLSRREIDVVNLLFLGLKNAQIAGKLYVSEVTIKKHLQSIYEKIGVNNRTTLINRILTS